MASCLIALGANLGDAEKTLKSAVVRLAQDASITDLQVSRIYLTAPVGGPTGQPNFANAAATFETTLSPQQVLRQLQQIEGEFGRERTIQWGPRTLDLDLLLYDDVELTSSELTLPHPRMDYRRFVLEPAAEIAGDMVHPATGWKLSQLLTHLNSAVHYIAIAGTCWFAKQYVATSASAALHAGGTAVRLLTGRGVTTVGAPPTSDPDHSFTDHYCDLVERLATELTHPSGDSPGTWHIGGYSAEELRLGAQLWFTGAARAAAESAWEQAFASAPKPALLVYLKTPDDLLLFPATELARRQATERDALEQHIRSLRDYPVLELAADKPEAAIREITAAVLAMM